VIELACGKCDAVVGRIYETGDGVHVAGRTRDTTTVAERAVTMGVGRRQHRRDTRTATETALRGTDYADSEPNGGIMARRTTDVPAEPLIPVSRIAIVTGQLDEVIWRRLEARGWRAEQDWDDDWVVPRSQAREIYLELTAAKADYHRKQHEYTEKQQAAELAGRMQPVTAYEDAVRRGERRVPGVIVSCPGESPEPGWMDSAGEEE
jgi:hypothetical protein